MTIELKQLRTLACHTFSHCPTCRTDAQWRKDVVGVEYFDCPYGVKVNGENIKYPPKGLGDTIAKITKSVGIKPCGGCKKRQDKLNKLVPYKKE